MSHIHKNCLVFFLIILLTPITVGAERTQTRSVTLIDDGERRSVQTEAETVGEFINEQKNINEIERVFPSPSSKLTSNSHVIVYRSVSTNDASSPSSDTETVQKIREAPAWSLPQGKTLRIRGPYPADRGVHMPQDDRKNQPGLELKGQADFKVDQLKKLQGQGTLMLRATGYSPHALDTAPYDDGFSALGLPAGYGIVAVDPRVIPLGTYLYVEGYGYAIAADVGGDIKGKRIDLGFPNRQDALTFGTRWLQVHILG